MYQNQPPEVFYKKGVIKNLAKFKGKHLCQGLFFNKVTGLSLKTTLQEHLFSSKNMEIKMILIQYYTELFVLSVFQRYYYNEDHMDLFPM